MNVNSLKKDMSESISKADINQKASKFKSELFLGQKMKSCIAHLEEVFRVDMRNIKDDELAAKKLICLKNCRK